MTDANLLHAPIGVFDSGVGGLTVCSQLRKTLPAESLLYLGDTARVPYGSKSAETVARYAHACASLLVARNVKMLVIACNTASAFALHLLRESFTIPVLGVIEPGAVAACEMTRSGRIGVIGTRGVIGSGVYEQAIHRRMPAAQVFGTACPLFVPFVEEGWLEGDAIMSVAHRYLDTLLGHDIDTLVLGCTHYPLLRGVISEVAGESITLVDSATETARATKETLSSHDMLNPKTTPGTSRFLVSDAPELFMETGTQFMGHPLEQVEWVDICNR